MGLSNVIDDKPIDDFFIEKQKESDSDLDDENPPHHSEESRTKYL